MPWHVNGAIINEVNFAPLLGVGDVSRRYVGKYLDVLTEGKARIPVHVFIGGSEAADLAEKHRLALQAQGSCTFLLTPEHVTGPDGEILTLEQHTLGGRLRALLLRSDADAILVVASALEEWSAQPWVRDPASIKIVQHAQAAREPAAACDA